MLDQNIDREEFLNRLSEIVYGFNKLSGDEKFKLKHWLINVNLEEGGFKEDIEKIFNVNKKKGFDMTSNISKGLDKLKEKVIDNIATDIFSIENIEDLEKYFK